MARLARLVWRHGKRRGAVRYLKNANPPALQRQGVGAPQSNNNNANNLALLVSPSKDIDDVLDALQEGFAGLRDHVADLARAPQPLPPPVAEAAERRLATVIITLGARGHRSDDPLARVAIAIVQSAAVDAAGHPTWGAILRLGRHVMLERQELPTTDAIVAASWEREGLVAPWLRDDLLDLELSALHMAPAVVQADIREVCAAHHLRVGLAIGERYAAACRLRDHAQAIALARDIARWAEAPPP